MDQQMRDEIVETLRAMRAMMEMQMSMMEAMAPYLRAVYLAGQFMQPTLDHLTPGMVQVMGEKLRDKVIPELEKGLEQLQKLEQND